MNEDKTEEQGKADRQQATMQKFFKRLDREDRRLLRRAAARVFGKKETISEMAARLTREICDTDA